MKQRHNGNDEELDLAAPLRAYRKKKRWSYEQLAIFTDLSVGTIHKIVNGKSRGNEISRTKIIEALPELFGRTA